MKFLFYSSPLKNWICKNKILLKCEAGNVKHLWLSTIKCWNPYASQDSHKGNNIQS